MPNYAEAFYRELDRLTGRRADDGISKIETTRHRLPPVYVHFYRDFPSTDLLTAITIGVSLGMHGDEKGHAELVITVRSSDRAWGLGAAFLAEQARDQIALASGATLNMREPIARGSEMSAYVLGDSPPWAASPIYLRSSNGDRTVQFVTALPVYESELKRVRAEGPQGLVSSAAFDPYDVRREPVF